MLKLFRLGKGLYICPTCKTLGQYAEAFHRRQEKASSIFALQIQPHQRSDSVSVYWPDTEPYYMQVERSRPWWTLMQKPRMW